ncbi:hypothetical protein AB7M18_003912 [Pseudomonas viridiflava]|uniref:NACHT domain-containing protein n=1 Tax=Pseudomonas TaxID=286 RepID=UPI001AE9863F|nr:MULTISPECIES: hypothetical protein [Pseudomonas]MBP1144484.1 hypothetical protein [Pseudomonas sp. PvP027]MCK9696594.1 hypothetical protein [Pseudomonas syringae pv. syringae]MCK9725366.1 hypothetical protein [Pseudomonas syringae pv. syringae]
MRALADGYIPVDRTFRELEFDSAASDETVLTQVFGQESALRWEDLLREPRVVVLSEAGAGKTAEIQNAARRLRNAGKHAFFMRIESITSDLESAFEEGTHAEFHEWLASGEEGWLLLDSVDEARLRHPKDFEVAIKRLSLTLKSVMQQAHILITGRTSAWRVKTDLILCRTKFPFQLHRYESNEQDAPDELGVVSREDPPEQNAAAPFKIFALEPLDGDHITAFLRAKEVPAPKDFLNQVELMDAGSLTTRPQDLIELIDYWKINHTIGSRYDLMRSSVDRRLQERDQDRAQARSLTPLQSRKGARLVAAAATLCQQSAIQTPDGEHNDQGLDIREILPSWDDAKRQLLLERPIFDGGIYGTVRFHHRSVREYLTAEWLSELLKQDSSRQQVENLFFRSKYGLEVVIPVMRPVLSWLVLKDERILDHVCSLCPEVIFEGGDPSRLPLPVRIRILRDACKQLSRPAYSRSITDFSSIKRFAAPDLTDEIKALLIEFVHNEDTSWFLLLMVWQGRMTGAVEQTMHLALNSPLHGTRVAAFQALSEIGSKKNRQDVRTQILEEVDELHQEWLQELIPWLEPSEESVRWLVRALEQSAPAERYIIDSLTRVLSKHLADWPASILANLAIGLLELLNTPPFLQSFTTSISERFQWLTNPTAQIILALISSRAISAVSEPVLSLLRKIPMLHEVGELDSSRIVESLQQHVANWPELNQVLFWYDVAESREYLRSYSHGLQPLVLSSQVGIFGHLWSFDEKDLVWICGDIRNRELPDDKSVALTLAFSLYRDSGERSDVLEYIISACPRDDALEALLQNLINPPHNPPQEWAVQHERLRRKAARRALVKDGRKRQWRERLQAEKALIRAPQVPGQFNKYQCYLLERLSRPSNGSSNWSERTWRDLTPEFGEDVASAFRDGAVEFWREYKPLLRSEGAVQNSTLYSVIFGLVGLSIEAREDEGWLKALSHEEAVLATRYGLHELNGFPGWLPGLYREYPAAVLDILNKEIDFELTIKEPNSDSSYVLYDISWAGEWLWNGLAQSFIERLRITPKSVKRLRQMLTIIQGSSLEQTSIIGLVSRKAKATKDLTTAPLWFAAWVGVEPHMAIPALTARLSSIPDDASATDFAIRFITALVSSRRERALARDAFRTIDHMKALYLLMNTYIHEERDIRRANSGVYSPELRDDAQDARNALFTFIRDTPGKEAFYALLEISKHHPNSSSRPWMALQAKEKATLDANMAPWTPQQVCEFNDRLERTPATHRDLWDLTVVQLLDLKHSLEDGDSSIASLLQPAFQETDIRKYIGNWCRERSRNRYTVPQEEQLADDKRPDLRFHGQGFDAQVPVELKLAEKWSGDQLLERLENQLAGDYLRDIHSKYGVYLLVYHGQKPGKKWKLDAGKVAETFEELIEGLQQYWRKLAPQFPEVEDIEVIGVDLTKRGIPAQTPSRKRLKRQKSKP